MSYYLHYLPFHSKKVKFTNLTLTSDDSNIGYINSNKVQFSSQSSS